MYECLFMCIITEPSSGSIINYSIMIFVYDRAMNLKQNLIVFPLTLSSPFNNSKDSSNTNNNGNNIIL